jgi:hypothetical protein
MRTLTAEVAASGRAAGERFRGRLSVGVAAPASVRIEAVAPFGPPIFVLAAMGNDASILLPRDERVLEHADTSQLLGAVAGVPLNGSELNAVLTACPPIVAQAQGWEQGADWRVIADPGSGYELYLHRDRPSHAWRLVAARHSALLVEYQDRVGGVPKAARVSNVSADKRDSGSTFDVTLTLSQVETNVTLGAEVFRIDVPRGAKTITLRELEDARSRVREN